MPEVIWEKHPFPRSEAEALLSFPVTETQKGTEVSPCPEGMRTPSLTDSRQPTGPRNPPAWLLLQKARDELGAGSTQARTGSTHSQNGSHRARKPPTGAGARHTELLLPIVPQEQQFWVQGHLTKVLGHLAPGLLFFLSPRRRGFGQKPVFLLGEADQDDARNCPCDYHQ